MSAMIGLGLWLVTSCASSPSGEADAAIPDGAVDASICSLTIGLVGRWTLDAASIDGTSVHDASGNARHGTLGGATIPVSAPGRIAEGLENSAGVLALPELPLDTTADGATTVSFWFWRDPGAVGELNDVLVFLPDFPWYDLWLTHRDGSDTADLCFNSGERSCFGVRRTGLVGAWVHVVAIFHNGPMDQSELYLDGVATTPSCLSEKACDAPRIAGNPVVFGGPAGYSFRGRFDELRIYDRALGAAEVAALYSGASGCW